jgi:hypothetical protein
MPSKLQACLVSHIRLRQIALGDYHLVPWLLAMQSFLLSLSDSPSQ